MIRILALLLALLPAAVLAQPAPTGALVQTTVTCGVASTALLPAGSAMKFLLIQNTPGSGTVWINFSGVAAVAAPPSFALAGGATILWSPMNGFMPATAINCIALATPVAVTVLYQ